MIQSWKSGDETPVETAILNVLNLKIEAYNVNFISMARRTDFCFKRTYVSMFLCFRSIVCCFHVLYVVRDPLEK